MIMLLNDDFVRYVGDNNMKKLEHYFPTVSHLEVLQMQVLSTFVKLFPRILVDYILT